MGIHGEWTECGEHEEADMVSGRSVGNMKRQAW